MAASSAFAALVKEKAEIFRAMKEAGILSDREKELLELAGLDFHGEKKYQIQRKTPKQRKLSSRTRKKQASQRTLVMLTKPVETKQDRLRH